MSDETTGPELRGMGLLASNQQLRAEKRILENLLKTLAARLGGVVTVREADVQRCLGGKLEINEYPEMNSKERGALIEIRVTGIPPAVVVTDANGANG